MHTILQNYLFKKR